MAFIVIPPGDVDQGSVIDESLMSGKIKNDLDDLNSRVVALEALSGGGVAASDAEDVFADIIAGGETNEAQFWKVRHHPTISHVDGITVDSLEDLEQKDSRERFIFDSKFTINSLVSGTDAGQYLNKGYQIAQNEQVQFKIKKGENFFCIGSLFGSGSASVVRVYVDGINANTYGLKDEQGNAVAATLNVNNATVYYGKTFHYYGLDGEEHIITIKNENATAQVFYFLFMDVGYRSVDYAIDHKIKINAGVAQVGNIAAAFDEGEFTFTEPTAGLANGYTGMLKINEAGTVTKVDGLSPARTQIRPKSAIAFSGAVTTLPVRNVFAFPTNGICLFQHCDGSKWFFSYNGKTDTTPQGQSIDSIIWQKQPNEDFTFGPDKAGATYVANEIRGLGMIEYWAKPPILIDGTNNKIDFEITINGVTTQHTATVASGRYSADIVPLESAIRAAMQTAKPITGEYFAKYNELSQLWSVGVNDPQCSQIDFEWATGANSASSLGPTLGFTSDSTGQKTYIALSEKQHKAQRVFVADPNIRSSDHPTIKYNWAEVAAHSATEADALIEKTPGLGSYRRYGAGGYPQIDIYPDDDCCGITIYVMRDDQAMYYSAMIDMMGKISLVQADRPNDGSDPTIGQLLPIFISFPKGTHKVSIYNHTDDWSEIETGSSIPTFFGYRQHYTKPPWESLTPQEKVLKTFEVAPIRLFGTYYGHNGALYTPQPTNDNINTITESGTWSYLTGSASFNGNYKTSGTLNAYVEVEFVLQGDGGGIGLMTFENTTYLYDPVTFISAAAINEATDMVDRWQGFSAGAVYDRMSFFHIGLKAGTYKARFKNQHASNFLNAAIVVFDTVLPQQNAPTLTDIANTGQSVGFPLYGRRRNCFRYGANKIPSYVGEGTYKRGIVTHYDYTVNSESVNNPDDSVTVSDYSTMYWSTFRSTVTSEYQQYTTFCRSMCVIGGHFSGYSTTVQPAIDGRNLNTVSFAADTKGGAAPAATRLSMVPTVFKDFTYPCTFNASLTYNIADTRGLRTGKAILVDNTGAKEEVFIASFVTDTSFTISKALTVLTPANIVRVLFWGMHNTRMTATNATQWWMNHFLFEPLPIEESILRTRVSNEKFEEIVELEQALGATGGVTPQLFTMPMHSDGEAANSKSTDIVWVSGYMDTDESYRPRFRAFVASAGTAAKTIKARSKRQVIKNFDHKVRG